MILACFPGRSAQFVPSSRASMGSSSSVKYDSSDKFEEKALANEAPISVLQESPTESGDNDVVTELGGEEERRRLEKKLLWKLDCRMSIMIVIYILNYVCELSFFHTFSL